MRLVITGLYGRFNYNIHFSKNGITILTGPNGYGKSTILHCIEAFNNSDIDFFINLPFDIIHFSSEAGEVVLEKRENELLINQHSYPYKYHFGFRNNGYRRRYPELKLLDDRDFDYKDNDLQTMARVSGTIKMIGEQRLIKERTVFRNIGGERRAERVSTRTVEEIPRRLFLHITHTANQYSEVATRLDSSFPYRLLDKQNTDVISEEEFNKLYEEMNKKLKNLINNGISEVPDYGSYGNWRFSKEDAKVLKIFFDDFNEKYNVYDPLMKKISLFQNIVNRRFHFKFMKFSEKRELIIVDEKTKREIPLSTLSSGEQEILVLFYDLIFETSENTLILIDEPEISLHIEWQMMFIDDLKKIVELNKIGAIIATHSADIVGGNRDIQRDLGEMNHNGFYTESVE